MSKLKTLAFGALLSTSCVAIGAYLGGNVDIDWEGSSEIGSIELITVVLAALSVMLVILTIFLAVLGFIGLSTINDRLEEHSRQYFTNELQEGRPAFGLLRQVVRGIVYEGIEPVDNEEDFHDEEA